MAESKHFDELKSIINKELSASIREELSASIREELSASIREELKDTKKELEDTKKELEDTKKELKDTKKELDDALARENKWIQEIMYVKFLAIMHERESIKHTSCKQQYKYFGAGI